jgi:Icc protein
MNTPVIWLAARGPRVRIAQITDTHLEEAPGGRLLGMDTDTSLGHVLGLVRASAQPPDLILATGDLANHGSAAAYARFCACIDELGVPWFWLPGNHDEFASMQRLCGRKRRMVRSIRTGGWQILMLDSAVPGEVGGELGEHELLLLERLLGEEPACPALVCLHHPPVPIGCAWLDQQRVRDADAFFAVLSRHPQVRAVVWGHVHQEFSAARDGVRLLATPSTCVQFAPCSEDFRLDQRSPGMRWIELGADGSFDTRVERVKGVAFEFDRDSTGYM